MPSNQSSVPIALAIQSLRQELSQALLEGKGQDLKFELGPVELEFQVEVSWEAGAKGSAKGGVSFGIVSLGEAAGEAEAKRLKGRTHTVKLTLNPVAAQGGNVRVTNDDITDPDKID
ncbi:MAG: trypco2 family protein [Cyanobacteria bacterium J06555_13]